MSEPTTRHPRLRATALGAALVTLAWLTWWMLACSGGFLPGCMMIGLAVAWPCLVVLRRIWAPRIPALSGLTGAAGALIFVFALVALRPSGPGHAALREEGDAIVERLEAWRDATGSFPAELPEDLDLEDGAYYGGWQYDVGEDGFLLVVGDYAEHGFTMSRSLGGWYVDT